MVVRQAVPVGEDPLGVAQHRHLLLARVRGAGGLELAGGIAQLEGLRGATGAIPVYGAKLANTTARAQ